jgi:hypothetical protein
MLTLKEFEKKFLVSFIGKGLEIFIGTGIINLMKVKFYLKDF